MIEDIRVGFLALVAIISGLSTLIVSVTTIKSYITKVITKLVLDSVEEKIKEADKKSEERVINTTQSLQQSIDELSAQFKDYVTLATERDELQVAGLQANARDRITEAHTFYMLQGWIDEHTLYSLEEIAQIYFKTNGNHFTLSHMEDLRNLPTTPPNVDVVLPRKKFRKKEG